MAANAYLSSLSVNFILRAITALCSRYHARQEHSAHSVRLRSRRREGVPVVDPASTFIVNWSIKSQECRSSAESRICSHRRSRLAYRSLAKSRSIGFAGSFGASDTDLTSSCS
jgi:hypothetical protein